MNVAPVNSVKRWTLFCFSAVCAMFIAEQGIATSTAQKNLSQWKLGRAVSQGEYIGQEECARCHSKIAKSFMQSGMANALKPASECETLRAKVPLSFSLNGFTYRIEAQGQQFNYTITDGLQTLTMPLLWCFGHGASGQTFVVQHEDTFYETRVSYFTSLAGLEITPGASRETPASLRTAIGQPQRHAEIQGCVTCHSTPSQGTRAVTLEQFTPGLHCETCHGPGSLHVAAVKKAGNSAQIKQAIFNPGRWSPDDFNQQFCGACHRSWETVMQMPDRGGIANVRFQPYRLANSKCYSNPDDRRIACIACHDPHAPLEHQTATYDAKCLTCHQGGSASLKLSAKGRTAPACSSGKQQNCATCHMPKVEPSGLHFKFTDHWIRATKDGEAYPK